MIFPQRITERRLVDVLISFLREHHIVGREIRHYEKRIDIVTIKSDTDELWAIEAKISDWTRAISQAIVNQATSEKSYIALHSKNVHRVPPTILEQFGIGLISVGTKWGEVEIIKEAKRSLYINQLALDQIRSQVSRGKR